MEEDKISSDDEKFITEEELQQKLDILSLEMKTGTKLVTQQLEELVKD